jgi:hypothetical protein
MMGVEKFCTQMHQNTKTSVQLGNEVVVSSKSSSFFFINRITRCSTHQVFQHFQLTEKIAAMTTLNE